MQFKISPKSTVKSFIFDPIDSTLALLHFPPFPLPFAVPVFLGLILKGNYKERSDREVFTLDGTELHQAGSLLTVKYTN